MGKNTLHDSLMETIKSQLILSISTDTFIESLCKRIKNIRKKEEITDILIPLDLYELYLPILYKSDLFDKITKWELKRTGLIGSLLGVNFRIYLDIPTKEKWKNYIFYTVKDGQTKVLE